MFSIGKANPDKNTIGIMTPNIAIIIACCWVFDIVETNNPNPRVDIIYRNEQKNRKRILPLTGILKINDMAVSTIITAINPSITNGISLPMIN
jgi:hypothetical protein